MFDKEKGKYAPNDIPDDINLTIYTHYCIGGYEWNIGKLNHYDSDCSGENLVLVAQTPLYVRIPKIDNLKQKVIDALEAEKKKQMAEHHKKMFELQEKIDSLLCLTYQPASDAIDITANDLPF